METRKYLDIFYDIEISLTGEDLIRKLGKAGKMAWDEFRIRNI